jgi:myo-inositol-1-phosphate synthase
MAIDCIRCARLAADRGIGGPLDEISAFAMKHPPQQLRDTEARERLERWIAGGQR